MRRNEATHKNALLRLHHTTLNLLKADKLKQSIRFLQTLCLSAFNFFIRLRGKYILPYLFYFVKNKKRLHIHCSARRICNLYYLFYKTVNQHFCFCKRIFTGNIMYPLVTSEPCKLTFRIAA